MAILPESNRKITKQVIDLSGPQGNAFFILGTASSLGRQLGYTKEKIEEVNAEMTSSDYENLITVFDREFGEYVDLQR